MSIAALVLGKSGSGKSTSGRNLPPEETFWIKCTNKELPFKGGEKKYTLLDKEGKGNCLVTSDSDKIVKSLLFISEKRPDIKNIIVDDFQYIMGFEFMNRAKEKGYEKFNDLALHAFEVINTLKNKLRNDLFVVILTHSEENIIGGESVIKLKTIGKMLDEKITLEGMFSVVLQAVKEKNIETGKLEGFFITNSDDKSIVKSPDEMFASVKIPNDLLEVKKAMFEYYI